MYFQLVLTLGYYKVKDIDPKHSVDATIYQSNGMELQTGIDGTRRYEWTFEGYIPQQTSGNTVAWVYLDYNTIESKIPITWTLHTAPTHTGSQSTPTFDSTPLAYEPFVGGSSTQLTRDDADFGSLPYPTTLGTQPPVISDYNSAASTQMFVAYTNWDIIAGADPVVIAESELAAYTVTSEFSVGQATTWRSYNTAGYMARANPDQAGTYQIWFKTYDQQSPSRTQGQVASGFTYYSRYVTNYPLSAPASEKLANPSNPLTFVGMAWDGQPVYAGDGGNIPNGKAILVNGQGCAGLSGDYYTQTVACPSVNYPSNPNGVVNEFDQVLSVANSNVFAITGRHQCPFVWYAKEGFVRFYVYV
jgi:hypothetical protein